MKYINAASIYFLFLSNWIILKILLVFAIRVSKNELWELLANQQCHEIARRDTDSQCECCCKVFLNTEILTTRCDIIQSVWTLNSFPFTFSVILIISSIHLTISFVNCILTMLCYFTLALFYLARINSPVLWHCWFCNIYLAASAFEVFSNWALYKLTYSFIHSDKAFSCKRPPAVPNTR